LAPGHIAFILVTAKIQKEKNGFRSFGFLCNGSVTILHRCLSLPPACINGERWELMSRLRAAVRAELEVAEQPPDDGAPWRSLAPSLLGNSGVEELARALFSKVPHGDDEKTPIKTDEKYDRDPLEALRWTVELEGPAVATNGQGGPEAFAPLAKWSDLMTRRSALITMGGRKVEAEERKRGKEEGKRDEGKTKKEEGKRDDGGRKRARSADPERKGRTEPRRSEVGRAESSSRRGHSDRDRRADGRDAKRPHHSGRSRDRERADRHAERTKAKSWNLATLVHHVAECCLDTSSQSCRDQILKALDLAIDHSKNTSADRKQMRVRAEKVKHHFRSNKLGGDRPKKSSWKLHEYLEELFRRLDRDPATGAPSKSGTGAGAATTYRRDTREREVSARDTTGRVGDSRAGAGRGEAARGSDRRDRTADAGGRATSRSRAVSEPPVQECPPESTEPQFIDGPIPVMKCWDEECKMFYYYNESTGESTWENPNKDSTRSN